MSVKYFYCLFFLIVSFHSYADNLLKESLLSASVIYSDNFDSLDNNWVVEKRGGELTLEDGSQKPKTTVSIVDGMLDIDDSQGVTIWYANEIATPSIIEFDGMVVVNDGINDRGTDLNFFWMAQVNNSEPFFSKSKQRAGIMRKYDDMKLYYVGYGANDNSTTRFRIYPGDGTRPLLPQYDRSDKMFMNVPNTMTNIKIINYYDVVYVYSNGKLLYKIDKSSDEFNAGMFGFRTWKSHLRIDNFKVYSLKV